MSGQTEPILMAAWTWLKSNDLPNWITFGFTAVVWPLVLIYWNRRKVHNVSNLEVSLGAAQISIGQSPHRAVDLVFLNNTGSVVYLSCVRVKNCRNCFPVHRDVRRDIAENSHDLSFMDANGAYAHPQYTLQTNQTVKTSVALSQQLPDEFFLFRAPWYRRWLGLPKYFVLEYIAMVGEKKYSVTTVY